jgi:hypothetical protein
MKRRFYCGLSKRDPSQKADRNENSNQLEIMYQYVAQIRVTKLANFSTQLSCWIIREFHIPWR